jgi:hypothetical protein
MREQQLTWSLELCARRGSPHLLLPASLRDLLALPVRVTCHRRVWHACVTCEERERPGAHLELAMAVAGATGEQRWQEGWVSVGRGCGGEGGGGGGAQPI